MKVELWYDPVHTETGVRLNGYWQGREDIYGFLYSVCRYPLQAWLEPDGSWTGLHQQILDISRGEEVDLVFHGRETDFADVARALREAESIRLSHCLWDGEAAYAGLREQAEEILREVSPGAPAGMRLREALGMEESGAEAPDWYLTVETEEELRQAERAEEPCVLVRGVLLDSYDRLPGIERLTRSLHRPAEAVCCCIEDGARRREFVRYASQFPRYGFTFVKTDVPPKALLKKYGRPYLTRKAQERFLQAGERMDALAAGCSGKEMELRMQELIYREQQGALHPEEWRELAAMQSMKSWADRNAGAGAKYRALAEFRAVGQCGEREDHE